jgi:coproporphyrinogen III oxidase-like Fe-S oxidoreductase
MRNGWTNKVGLALLGIGATAIGTLLINSITFQRDARQEMRESKVRIEHLEKRDENIIKYMQQRIDEHMRRIDQRIEVLERKAR